MPLPEFDFLERLTEWGIVAAIIVGALAAGAGLFGAFQLAKWLLGLV